MFLRITHSFVQISLIPELICSPWWHVTSLWPHSPLNNGASLILKITMFKCFGVLAFNPYLLTSVHSSEQPFTSQFSSSSSLHRLFFFMVWTSAAMQINWNKRKLYFLHKKKGSTPRGLVWNTNMAASYRRFIVFEHQYGGHVKRFYKLWPSTGF